MNEKSYKYVVKDKIQHTSEIFTLRITLENNSIPRFIPGQFINVYFPETGISEGKSYSISSSPQEKTLNLTIKKMGRFSERLCGSKIGDKISASMPYGFFFTEEKDTKMILITGGIGITPFMSVISHNLNKRNERPIHLFWSVKKEKDLFQKNTFDQYASKNSNFKVSYFVTEEKITETKIKKRRIGLDDFKIYTTDPKSEFFICGSIAFVRDFWNILKKGGVEEENIYTESFF